MTIDMNDKAPDFSVIATGDRTLTRMLYKFAWRPCTIYRQLLLELYAVTLTPLYLNNSGTDTIRV